MSGKFPIIIKTSFVDPSTHTNPLSNTSVLVLSLSFPFKLTRFRLRQLSVLSYYTATRAAAKKNKWNKAYQLWSFLCFVFIFYSSLFLYFFYARFAYYLWLLLFCTYLCHLIFSPSFFRNSHCFQYFFFIIFIYLHYAPKSLVVNLSQIKCKIMEVKLECKVKVFALRIEGRRGRTRGGKRFDLIRFNRKGRRKDHLLALYC